MKWKCSTCDTKVKGDTCPNCGAMLPDPATTPATAKMHRALRSVPFVLGVICFTLALLLNVAMGLVTRQVVSPADVHEAIAAVEKEAGVALPENISDAIHNAVEITKTDVSDIVSANLLSVLACVGLWLLVATGFRSGRIGRAGAVILKIITVFTFVCVCLGMAVVAALAVFLVFGQNWLLKMIADLGAWDSLLQAIRSLMHEPLYATVVWVTAGVMLFSMLIVLLFLAGAIKTENEVIRVSKFGQGKKVSVFMCILLILSAATCLTNGAIAAVSLKLWSASALLNGLWMLMFAITVLRYRRWSREVLWSDLHPEAVDRAYAAIPTGLGTDELLDTVTYGAPDAAKAAQPAVPVQKVEPIEPETPAVPVQSVEPVKPAVPVEPEAVKPAGKAVDQFMASIRPETEPAKPAAPVTTVCPHCGAVMQGKAFFCEECGQVL